MDMKIPLVRFFSEGDEQRFFAALAAIPAIKTHTGQGRNFTLKIDCRVLTTPMLRELVALLVRYSADLSSLCEFSRQKRFHWLNEPGNFWHKHFLPAPSTPAGAYEYASYIFDDLS